MIILKVVCRVMVLAAIFLAVNSLNPLTGVSQIAPPTDLLQEAKIVYEKEEDYFQKRLQSNWTEIYSYQHPDFRKNIPFDVFKFFDGKVSKNYREEMKANLSGNETAIQEVINKNQEKKDILGFPTIRMYRMFSDPLFTVEKHTIDTIAVSKDGKYAKVMYKANIDAQFQPGLWRGYKRYKFVLSAEDFWEKVGDTWYVAFLKKEISVSGTPMRYYWVPENNAEWSKFEFVEYDAGLLRSGNSAENNSLKTDK